MKINNVEFTASAVDPKGYPDDDLPEVVFLGRSNVGKSTFINAFTKKKRLAYTSSTPGKTQVLNFFLINEEFYVVDVPGYGYARVSKDKIKKFGQMIETYLTKRESLKLAVLLVDFKVGPTQDDILMYDFLAYFDIPILIVATKKDKVKSSLFSKHKQQIFKKLENLDEQNLIIYSKNTPSTLDSFYTYLSDSIK